MTQQAETAVPLISDSISAIPFSGPENPPIYPRSDEHNFGSPMHSLDGPPHQVYDHLREHAPVAWQEGSTEQGFWLLTRHEDVRHVSRHTEIFSSQRRGILQFTGDPEQGIPRLWRSSLNSMINMDGDWHKQLRDRHTPHFTPEAVAQLQVKVQDKAKSLIDAFPKTGHCNLVEYLSQELPLFTLSEILGVGEADRPKLVRWMHYLEMASYLITIQNLPPEQIPEGAPEVSEDFFMKFLDNVAEMFDYGMHQLKSRREQPEDSQKDLLATIAWTHLCDELLADEYLDGSWLLIVFAGNDTTRNTLSGTMELLSKFPQQRAKLMADRSLMDGMVEEAIRMVSPVQYMARTATQDTEIRGQKIAAGEKVVMYYSAANRDPEVFENPHRFDIERKNANRQVSFGFGQHLCIGHRVARLQLKTAYNQMLSRYPDITWDGEKILYAPNNFVVAIQHLGVDYTP